MLRLRRLTRDAGLTPLDVELLLVSLLPDLDTRFERLYGYLNDDVTRRRASVALALELAGASPMVGGRAGPAGAEPAAAAARLLVVDDPDRPLLTRGLRVPDRVAAHLLGDDAPDPLLAPADRDRAAVRHAAGRAADPGPRRRRRAGAHPGAHAGHRGRPSPWRPCPATAGRRWCSTCAGSPPARTRGSVVTVAAREALLRGAGLVAGPVEALAESAPDAVHRLAQAGVPVVLVGTATWDPQWSAEAPLLIDAPALGGRERLELWHGVLQARQPADRRRPWSPPISLWAPARYSRRSGPPRPRPG